MKRLFKPTKAGMVATDDDLDNDILKGDIIIMNQHTGNPVCLFRDLSHMAADAKAEQ